MARKRKIIVNIILGAIIGLVITSLFKSRSETVLNFDVCRPRSKTDFKPTYGRFEFVGSSAINSSKNDNLLFVGVMTAAKYVDNRAKTVYETWGKNVPGKIVFFSSEASRSNEIPLVSLPGIDDSYPPQRKSFTMLKYMHDNYIDRYEWFLRADDDVYVRTDRLEALLRSVDSRKAWFIGQTGRGNNDEFGLLSLEENENFCMGGPGVIFSRETLRRMAPNIDKCLGNLYTTHEDVELGRCVRKFAGVPCTWSYEMQVILYHNQSGEAAFSGDLKQKEVHRAITMHPVKQPQYMHRLHNYVKGLEIQEKQQESIDLHRDIASSMSYLGIKPNQLSNVELIEDLPLYPEPLGSENYLGDPELLGTPIGLNRYNSKTLEDVLDWELISKSLYSYKDLNPKRRIGSTLKEGLSDIVREVMELINLYSKQRGRIIDFKEILYGYWRLDPLHGVDLILDMSLTYKKYRGHKMTVPVRRHAYIQQTFTETQIREVNIIKEEIDSKAKDADVFLQHKTFINDVIAKIGENLPLPVALNSKTNTNRQYINLILPLSGRYETFKRFIKIYVDICIKEQELTRLLVVLYRNEKTLEDFTRSIDLITATQRKYPNSEITYKVIGETFSRGRALQHGVSVYQSDDLLFFIDVDIVFSHKSLLRIRQNTLKNYKVYFPIVYTLYSPKFLNKKYENTNSYIDLNLDNQNGFWRQFGFGIASMYKTDFEDLGGFNTSIAGWGLEDVAFYDNVIKSSIKIVRSVDSGLIHVYHPVECDSKLVQAQKDMCAGTRANILGSLYDLQNYYKQYKYLFR